MKEEWIELAGLRAVSVGDPTASVVVVLLHGFQMDPLDLTPFAHSMNVPAWFLFPEGPKSAQPRGRAWWFIDHLLRDEALKKGPRDFAPQHPPDLPEARTKIAAFIRALPVGGRPLVLGGFSQGGMLICDTLLRESLCPSLLALLSTSRISYDDWKTLPSEHLRELPVLVTHGHSDADLAFSAGEALRDFLVERGARVDWLPFDQGHEIPLVVWRKLRNHVNALLRGNIIKK
jgi:phospholipase/carboxylesterase